MDTATPPDFSCAKTQAAFSWARATVERGDLDVRVPWGSHQLPLPWAILGLAKRKGAWPDHGDDFGAGNPKTQKTTIELLHAYLDRGGLLLDDRTRHELTEGPPGLLAIGNPGDFTKPFLDPMERWAQIKKVAKYSNPPDASPHINLLLLNDARIVNAWVDEAGPFEETQQQGRGHLLLLDLARGLIRLGGGNERGGWLAAMARIERAHGDQWSVAGLGAGGLHGSIAGELIKSWDPNMVQFVLDRYGSVVEQCRIRWPEEGFGDFALREQVKLLTYIGGLPEDEEGHRQFENFKRKTSSLLNLHMQERIASGAWKRNRFGGLEIPQEDYYNLTTWTGSLFRSRIGAERAIDLLEVFEETCGLDVSGPSLDNIHDEDQPLLPAGWQQTALAAAWRRRKLASFSQQSKAASGQKPKL